MANVRLDLAPEEACFLASTFPQIDKVNGSNFPVTGLRFDAAADEAAFWKIDSFGYGSGNVTCEILWYAENATSGVVRWEAAIAAITPDTDSQDVTTDGLATAQTVDDTHLGTVGKRVHKASVTISNLDSIAADDIVWVRIRRIGSNGADTMANDAWLIQGRLTYSDA
ncbi:hypothetical protein SMD44_00897 [Streptomyces alboflavus]|uniref:Uncharacterized protein n=1 Tax=Streptomyces alboflavus TaxID=67267 RepID=A0A1Z1W536_9ACTN|nr:hypothetical protein [Streptomyces alboflavus]ARX81499.1 hypothetical protein SMD44_00897 [Streptomyces alboflavus]